MLAVALVAGCSSTNTSGTPAAPASSAAGAATGAAAFRGTPPAASGTIAAVTGSTMQVQNPQDGQVAVTWTATTSFTDTVTVPLSAVRAGSCVTAIAPSGTSRTATSFTAQRVSVSTPVNGRCGGSPGGRFPSGAPGNLPSGRPSGRPSGFPSGAPGGRSAFGAVAVGTVTSVSGHSIVIAARNFGASGVVSKSITVGPVTVITTQRDGTAAAVKVGRCATVQGTTGSTGAVTATRIRITDAVGGQCPSGRGRFGGN